MLWSMPQALFVRKNALLAETRLRCLVEHLRYTADFVGRQCFSSTSMVPWRAGGARLCFVFSKIHKFHKFGNRRCLSSGSRFHTNCKRNTAQYRTTSRVGLQILWNFDLHPNSPNLDTCLHFLVT